MAESRKQYLERRVQEATNLGRTVDVVIPKNPTKAQLTALDDKINKVLYPTGKYGDTSAIPVIDPNVAIAAEQRRQFQVLQEQQQATKRQSAFDLAKSFAVEYGLGESIADRIVDLTVNQGYSETALTLALRQSPEYKTRFSGIEKYNSNFASAIASGKKAQPLTPAQYIKAEQEYQEILTRYGVGDLASQETFSELIGGDVSAIELKDRVENVYDKIRNADSVLKEELKTYFPTLTEADFAKSLLTGKSPEDMASSLKRRVSQAEISSEAARAGVGGLTIGRASELEQMGITRTLARVGYSKIAAQQSTLEKLGGIYNQDVTGLQTELEAEQFQGLASQRRKKLEETEQATFAGRSGMSQVSLSQGTAGTF